MSERVKNIDTSFVKLENLSDGNIKLDFNTTLEDLFNYLAIITGVLTFGTGMATISSFITDNSGKNDLDLKVFIGIFLCLILIFIISLRLRHFTDNYYIIDIPAKKLFYHFQFLFIKKKIFKADLSEIIAISVDYKLRRAGRRPWDYYCIVFLTSYGKKIRVSNWEGEFLNNTNVVDFINKSGLEISEVLNIPFIPGKTKKSVHLCRNINGCNVVFMNYSDLTYLLMLFIIINILAYFIFYSFLLVNYLYVK